MSALAVSRQRKKQVIQEVRDAIILEHLPLAKTIAIRVHENLPVHVDLDDLVHAGILGLFDAVEKYDPEKKVQFHSYAKHRIKGAILDSLRQLDWASRDLRRRQKQIDAITRELTLKFGRTPNPAEISEAMGVSPERWNRILMELRSLGTVSASGGEEERDYLQEFAATPEFAPDRICAQSQLRSTLARAVGTLPERYQKVVALYYTNDLTMKEIGDLIGVNESRVSQIHKTALEKMAAALQSEGIHSSEAF